ncbi:MAG: TIM barrel protein [Bacteroidales bacterium]|jgi:sugar phosphate isomerase/epimerase|nr:TIM barrel protein [Bacteroidales bacterium]
MTINRRDFLKTAAVTTGGSVFAASGIAATSAAGKTPKVELKISLQEGKAPGASLNEQFDFMEQHGVVGFEPGGGNLQNRVKEIKDALSGRNIKVSAICAGFKGFILAENEAVRREFFDTMKVIIAAAGEIGSTGVIMVPAFNSQKPCKPHTQDTRNFLVEQLRTLGDYAVTHNTTVILEPLNRGEAFYLRQVADAASICRDANHHGVRCMGDFWHMTHEETSDKGAFLSAGEYLQHVHIASRKCRSMPGEDGEADNYIDGFRGLKMLGYDKYVSFECGLQSKDRAATLIAALKLLRDQWKAAKS